jgi:hypothetical protein
MKALIDLIMLVAKALRLCFKQHSNDHHMMKATASGMISLFLLICGVISLAFSAYYLLISWLISPAAASFIIALAFLAASGIGLWITNHLLHKKNKSSQIHCLESLAHAFMEGYSSSKNSSEHPPKT